ncbi:female-specific protein transformer-like isoform X1 [Vespa mandarinia]|uniref:female-specific protein transformer-like isoform X1 n=1 Tax=Vespa mandarinia TaxID=7446 RepID=UPI0016142DD5|nr:female-specific protein transformer-like isoform X1 [Vespa mandarinia]
MKRSSSSLGSNDERRKELRKDDHNSQPHSRLEEGRQRRRQQWLIQQELEREHERLKQKMILEYELKRVREQGASHSRGRLTDESNSKSRTRDRSLENVCIKNATATSSKSPAIPGKSNTSCGTTSLFKGPEGIQISEKELHCIKVDIHRNIPVKGQISELQRDIINPEDVIIIRRSGYSSLQMQRWIMNYSYREGSKPIFEREEIESTSKKVEEIKERRTVTAVESGDSVNRSKSFRRRSPSSNSLRHRSQRSSSYRSKSKDSKDSSYKFDRYTSRTSDGGQRRERRRERSRERSKERRNKYKGDDRSSGRYRSSRNRESPFQEYRDHRRDSYSKQDFRHRNESRKEEGSNSSNKSRNRPVGNRERERRSRSRSSRSRSRSHSRSRDNRYRERQMVPCHPFNQVPYPVYYGPRPMMVEPIMSIRGRIPMATGRLPHPLIRQIRPFPPRIIPPNVYRLGPPPNYRFGPMF